MTVTASAAPTTANDVTVAAPAVAPLVAAAIAAAATSFGAGAPFAPARVARLDADEAFPDEECRLLDACGMPAAYVPPHLGGSGGGLPDLVNALRVVARHDLTTAVAHGKTFLGAAPVWVAGEARQTERLAALVLDGNAVSWGLTERGRGSDLLAGRLSATAVAAAPEASLAADNMPAWRLDGEKWLINNATRGRLLTVLARTDPEGGPRGFSLFLVDKRTLAPGTWRCLPRERTHGIRGADISGIAFDGAEVPAHALVGEVGGGLETVLLALQLTRTACCALSLGAGDLALRLAVDLARNRAMYGRTLIELPYTRRLLGAAAADLALAEAAATVAARCAHVLPGELSVVAAIAKACVPDLTQQALDACAEVLGARGFLEEVHEHGLFQKLDRDHRIVAVFDGTTAVNRSLLIKQFPTLARGHRRRAHDPATLAAAVDPAAPLPELDPSRLRLLSREGCSVVQALPDAVERLAGLAGDDGAAGRVAWLGRRLAAAADATAVRMAATRPSAVHDVPPQSFALARDYELCFAGASALHLWLAEPHPRREAALARAVQLLHPGDETVAELAFRAGEALLPSVASDAPARQDGDR